MQNARSQEKILIVGAGPIGLACAISAKRRGLDPLVIDAGAVVEAIVRYPIGMTFFTTPERLEIGGHPLVSAGSKPTREEALKYYRKVAHNERIRLRTYAKLQSAHRDGETITCTIENSGNTSFLNCERLILATGYFDHPNLLNVPGEDLPHVHHYFREAHVDMGLDVTVIGGKNSAIEAALELFRAGARVTLVHRKTEFARSVKYWIKPDIENRIKAGEVHAYLGAEVTSIHVDHVKVRTLEGRSVTVPAIRVYALTGFHPDFELFRKIGIALDEDGVPELDETSMETNVPGVYMAGSIIRGNRISEIFIENGRFDGEKIFGDAESRQTASRQYKEINRYYGE